MLESRSCTKCGLAKALDAYEVTTKDGKCRRAVCKPCYSQLKKERAKAGAVNHAPDTTPKPAACVKCGNGPDVVDFKWRSDVKQGGWRAECNACYNVKGYSEDYRKRERLHDEAAYLARNASMHLAWARKNPDKVKEQQVKTATVDTRKIKTVKVSASQRGVEFNDADAEAMREKLALACHYCEYVPAHGEPLNGLDRVNAVAGYTDANTVPCCSTCNTMKGPLHIDEFITNIRAIVAYCNLALPTVASRCRMAPFSGSAEKRAADKVDKSGALPHDVKVRLWSQPCYLCGRGPALGIDRVDSRFGYLEGNVMPCCSFHCNYMKKDMALADFKEHVTHVHAHTTHWVIGDLMDLPLQTFGAQLREPVGVLDPSGALMMVFPSMKTAARCIAGDAINIRQAADRKGFYHGHLWRRASRQEFASNEMCGEVAENIMKISLAGWGVQNRQRL